MSKKNILKSSSPGKARNPARVFIVDDHPFLRAGIRTLLNTQTDMVCCGEADSAKDALAQIDVAKPDVMVVDVSLPEADGLDLVREIRVRFGKIPALMLSMHSESTYAEQALRAGAAGYMTKSEPPERILEALRTILSGGKFFSQRLAMAVLDSFGSGSLPSDRQTGVKSFSARELQMFEGIGLGLSIKQLAGKYGLSPKTVETHCARIKQKLGLSDGKALIRAAVRWMDEEASGVAKNR